MWYSTTMTKPNNSEEKIMSLMKYKTRHPHPFFRDANRFFGYESLDSTIPVDLLENDNEYIIVANVPGISKENIEIEVNQKTLLLRAKLEEVEDKEEEESSTKFVHRERIATSFSRKVRFAQPVNSKEAVTTLIDGVLTITLPKSEEAKSVKLTVN